MFSRLYIENFRNLNNEEISFRTKGGTLKQAAFFYGDNGVGKTSIIYALGFLKRTTDAYLFNTRIAQNNVNEAPYHLKEEAQRHLRLGSQGPLIISYELIVDNEMYVFHLEFDMFGVIQKESLFKKTRGYFEVLYSNTHNDLYLNESEFDVHIRQWLRSSFNENSKEYTVLSLLFYAHRTKLLRFKNHLNAFMTRVGRFHLHHNRLHHQNHYNIVENRGLYVKQGYVSSEFELFHKASSVVITQVVKAIYPNISHVRYEFQKREDGKLDYHLNTFIQVDDKVQIASDDILPSSYFKLLDFCNSILDTYVGNALVYDDMNALFSSETLKLLINGMLQRSSGQLIMTFNTPELLNFIDPKFSYIFTEQDGLVSVRCIDDLETIRGSHNILKRYESGIYNHYVPIKQSAKVYKLLMWFEQYINPFKKKNGL